VNAERRERARKARLSNPPRSGAVSVDAEKLHVRRVKRGEILMVHLLSTLFLKYGLVSREERSLTVAALIGAARVSKRFLDTLANF
jgi:hypothetical protein